MKWRMCLFLAIGSLMVGGGFMNCSKQSSGGKSSATEAPSVAQVFPTEKLSIQSKDSVLAVLATTSISARGGLPPYYYSVEPYFMGTISDSGLYKAPDQAGLVAIIVTDSSGQTASISLQIGTTERTPVVIDNKDFNGLTDIWMSQPGTHNAQGCPSGYQRPPTANAVIADADPSPTGVIAWGVFFCHTSDPAATAIVTDVFVTEPKRDQPEACPQGYQPRKTIVDCHKGVGSCTDWYFQNLCVKIGPVQNAEAVITYFYLTDTFAHVSDPQCDDGDVPVGQTVDCTANGQYPTPTCIGIQRYCARRHIIPR